MRQARYAASQRHSHFGLLVEMRRHRKLGISKVHNTNDVSLTLLDIIFLYKKEKQRVVKAFW